MTIITDYYNPGPNSRMSTNKQQSAGLRTEARKAQILQSPNAKTILFYYMSFLSCQSDLLLPVVPTSHFPPQVDGNDGCCSLTFLTESCVVAPLTPVRFFFCYTIWVNVTYYFQGSAQVKCELNIHFMGTETAVLYILSRGPAWEEMQYK